MEDRVKERLENAHKHITIAGTELDSASSMGLGFELSKPLNIAFKELELMRYLLYTYLGEKTIPELEEAMDVLGVVNLNSVKAYLNMNKDT